MQNITLIFLPECFTFYRHRNNLFIFYIAIDMQDLLKILYVEIFLIQQILKGSN